METNKDKHAPSSDGLLEAKCMSCGSTLIAVKLDPETRRAVKLYEAVKTCFTDLFNQEKTGGK